MVKCSCPSLCHHDVKEFKKSIKRVRKQLDTPKKIREFLAQNPAMKNLGN